MIKSAIPCIGFIFENEEIILSSIHVLPSIRINSSFDSSFQIATRERKSFNVPGAISSCMVLCRDTVYRIRFRLDG